MRHIDTHIIHCSASPDDMDIGVKEIRQWHEQRGWSDIGYHFVIRRDGTIELGRPIEIMGAHAYGHNRDSIGTCLVGINNFTEAQFNSLRKLQKTIECMVPQLKTIPHRAVTEHKTCPNFDIYEILDIDKTE